MTVFQYNLIHKNTWWAVFGPQDVACQPLYYMMASISQMMTGKTLAGGLMVDIKKYMNVHIRQR